MLFRYGLARDIAPIGVRANCILPGLIDTPIYGTGAASDEFKARLGAAMTALYIFKREKLYTVDPECWGYKPHDWASIAAWNLGMKDIALEHAQKCVEMAPDDLRLRANLKLIVCAHKKTMTIAQTRSVVTAVMSSIAFFIISLW